jgi:hypothetical protein
MFVIYINRRKKCIDCVGYIVVSKTSGFDIFNMLQLFSVVNCWLKCMLLEPYNQTDHPECKSRPDSGLSAITELDPGYITGKLIPHVVC